jgi:hypothetical protein
MKRLVILTTISLAFFAPFALGKLLDPHSPPNLILDALVKELDSKEIDVVRRWDNKSPTPRERAILAPLKGFKSSAEAKASKTAWMKDFEGNIHSFLVGFKTDSTHLNKESTDFSTFTREWETIPKSKRIFISFTQVDAAYADTIKEALESKGYKTFIFLSSSHSSPFLTSQEAGHLFATAGHYFVIDTKNARNSPGVWFEKALLGRYGGSSPSDLGGPGSPPHSPSPRPARPPSSPSPTTEFIGCICKTFRNGRLINSFQIPPGAQCGKQICTKKSVDP